MAEINLTIAAIKCRLAAKRTDFTEWQKRLKIHAQAFKHYTSLVNAGK